MISNKKYIVIKKDTKDSEHIKGRGNKTYKVWRQLLKRALGDDYKSKYPTYADCSVCEDWLKFSKFKEWFDKNYRYDLEEQGVRLELDKDLLSNGDKVYSPETCVFLPSCVNNFIAKNKNTNTSGYIGINFNKNTNKWIVRIAEFRKSKRKYCGLFENIEDAIEVYKKEYNIQKLKVCEYLKELKYNDSIVSKIESLEVYNADN